MQQKPAVLSKAELLTVLQEITNGVSSGDTLEGFIEFLMGDEPFSFNVKARYRTNNLQGQGCLRVVGKLE